MSKLYDFISNINNNSWYGFSKEQIRNNGQMLIDTVQNLILTNDFEAFNTFWAMESLKSMLQTLSIRESISYDSAAQILTEYFYISPVMDS